MSTSWLCASSRSSSGVNFTWAGPRRPKTCTSVTGDAREAPVHVVRDLGDQQVLGVLGEHAGHVERHVAVADHRDLRGLERPGARHVRVPVVPGDEVGGAVGAVQLDARDVQVRVADGAGGEDDRVVVLAQVVEVVRSVP